MDLKSELLKSIWYAFTSLEAEHSGKVSKSQLKVLSHNLYTALNIPHDPVALEEHFQDNDNGPVSNQGYMPYLNKYILAKATEGTFNKETFDDLCWMMTSKKNLKPSILQGLCSQADCFKLFCLFNLLSEDRYPLVIIQPELEYLLKKIAAAMNKDYDGKLLEALLAKNPSLQDGLSVWEFLEHVSAGLLIRADSKEAFSVALGDVFMEMYHNLLKKGYMQKKGHMRRNWQERWFILKPGFMAYYVNEDQKEKKGEVQLDGSCVVENVPDKEGKRCLFCVKTPGRTYEISVSDQKQRLEWMQAVQTAIRLKAEGKCSLQHELKLRRRELRDFTQSSQSNQINLSSQNESSAQSSQSGKNGQSDQNVKSSQSSQSSLSMESSQSTTNSQSDQNAQSSLSMLSSQSRKNSQSDQNVEGSQSSQSSLSTQSCQSSTNSQSDQKDQSSLITESSQSNKSNQSNQSGQTSQSSQSSQREPSAELQQPSSEMLQGEPKSIEPDLEIIDIIQHHLEMEAHRKEEAAKEKTMQEEQQQELQRQLEEANSARESMAVQLAKMEKDVQQQKKRIQELELTQLKLEEALNNQIQARLEEETIRHNLERQLEEAQKKLAELLLLQGNLETLAPAERSHEKAPQTLQNEEHRPSPSSLSITSTSTPPSLSQPPSSLPQHLAGVTETHQHNLETSESHSKAHHMRVWNVQLNRLMKPITPADKIERLPVRSTCAKQGQALTSTEFIAKYQPNVNQETEVSDSQLSNTEEESRSEDPPSASV